jgi:alkanesulfonate monooxygenase SsuD/methylene tetrahydromethanopterin reductase-like flavin-dependent oxidoreductase (luciferase family)
MDGSYFSYEGEIFQIDAMKLCPVPTEPVPLLVGGHAKPALRRAGQLGDGWISAGVSPAELKSMIEQINEHRKRSERDHLPFENQAMTAEAFSLEGLQDLAQMGVGEVIVAFRNPYDKQPDTQTVEEKIGMINWYAETLIHPYRQRHGG